MNTDSELLKIAERFLIEKRIPFNNVISNTSGYITYTDGNKTIMYDKQSGKTEELSS
jgi:hypothetical protein